MNALIPFLFFLAAQEIEPPETVNGEILGTAEEFKTPGPARICISWTSVDLESGETAYLSYLGFHSGSVTVTGPRGNFVVTDGEALADNRKAARLVPDRQGRRIVRRSSKGEIRYVIYAPGYPPGSERPRVIVQGGALGRSPARDAALLDRIIINRDEPTGCRRHFDYGSEITIRENK